MAYQNVPQGIGLVLSNKLATLTELSTTLGVQDLYDLMEVALVDLYNQHLATKDVAKH